MLHEKEFTLYLTRNLWVLPKLKALWRRNFEWIKQGTLFLGMTRNLGKEINGRLVFCDLYLGSTGNLVFVKELAGVLSHI